MTVDYPQVGCGDGSGVNYWNVGEALHHRWCMPDEISDPKGTSSHRSDTTWGGGGRLKVKATIGGVSVTDLSSAVIQKAAE